MGRNGQVNSKPNNQNQIRPSLSIQGSQGQCHSSSSLFAGSGQMFPERFSGQNINLPPQEINTNIVPNNSWNVGVSLRESTTGMGSNIASSSRNGQVNSNPNNQNQIRPISIQGSQGQCHSSNSLFAGSGQMFPERFFGQNIKLPPQEINTNIVPNNSCNVGVSLHESTTGMGSNIASSSRNGQVNSNPNNQIQIRPSLSIQGSQGQCHSSSSLFAGSGQMIPERFSGQNINLLPQEINTNIGPNNSCNAGVSLHESVIGMGSNIASSSNSFTRNLQELPNSINGSNFHYQGTPSRGHGEMNPAINLESLSLSLSPCPDESLADQSGTNSPTVNTDNNIGYVVEEQVDIDSTSANTMCLPFKRSSNDFEGEFQEGESSNMGAQVEIAEQHVVTSQVNANVNANSNDNVNPSPLMQIMDPSIVTRYSTIEIRQSLMAIEDGGDVEQPPLGDANDDMRYIMEAQVQVAVERLRFGRVLRAQDVMVLVYSNRVRTIEDATTVEEELEEIMGAMLGLREETIMKYIKHENFVLEDKETQEMCCICQEEYVNGDEVGKLDCEHSFHIECIKQWLKQKNECPICRQMALLSNYEGDDNDDDQQIPFMELVSM